MKNTAIVFWSSCGCTEAGFVSPWQPTAYKFETNKKISGENIYLDTSGRNCDTLMITGENIWSEGDNEKKGPLKWIL